MRTKCPSLWIASLALLAAPAAASDGALQINQACAVQTGCFTGDTAGFPVTIAAPGSYILTANLVVPDQNTTAIRIEAPSVHIDLNGFEIVRSGCEGAVLSCTPGTGSGFGIVVASPDTPGVSVVNGGVTGMGLIGVELGIQSLVANVKVRWSRLNGIIVRRGSIVSGSSVYDNGSSGINVAEGSIVSGNTVHENEHHGIDAGHGSTVSGNTVRSNGLVGLALAGTSPYRENTVTDNLAGGVFGGVNLGDNYCAGPSVGSASCP